MKHLLAAISPHGYGHLGMVAPILNRLLAQNPLLKITVRTTLPEEVLRRRIEGNFTIDPGADDFGMVQANSLIVEREESCKRYAEFHQNWEQRVRECAAELAKHKPDMILANAPYLTLAAASKAGIPAVGYSCLNWYDISRYYCTQPQIQQQILDAYNSADLFICPTPTMPMNSFTNTLFVGPVATVGNDRRNTLNEMLGITTDTRLVLVSLGGINHHIQIENWSLSDKIYYLVPEHWHLNRYSGFTAIGSLPFPQTDLIASADVVISKPGYGTTTECAVAGTPFLYIKRPDWPEQSHIIDWMNDNIRCAEIKESDLDSGSFTHDIECLLQQEQKPPIEPTGIDDIVSYLNSHY